MGEMADFALDQVMDEETARFEYRSGSRRISPQQAYDEGFIDEQGYEPNANSGSRPLSMSCRYCGIGGLKWSKASGIWRLVDFYDKVHSCDRYKRKET